MALPPPAWFPDPEDPTRLRWWDGAQWTTMRSPVQGPNPQEGGPAEPSSLRAAPGGTRSPAATSRGWRPTVWFWVSASLLVIVASRELVVGALGGCFIFLGVAGTVTAVYALATKRRTWANFPPDKRIRWLAVTASVLLLVVGVVVSGSANAASGRGGPEAAVNSPAVHQSPTPSRSATSAPTPTPTPVMTEVDYTGTSEAAAQSELEAHGVTVDLTTSDGEAPPADWAGWSIVSESPAAGSPLYSGSVVTLVLSPPPPSPAPAPSPAPTPAPAPAPAAPAPAAPAPAAPAPAPQSPTGITDVDPGGFCPDADVGLPGTASNGRTYVCGAKGADASGHYHWND
jgi:hypothetical protein